MNIKALFKPKAPQHPPADTRYSFTFPGDKAVSHVAAGTSIEAALARIEQEKARLLAIIAKASEAGPADVLASAIERQRAEVKRCATDMAKARGQLMISAISEQEANAVMKLEQQARSKLTNLGIEFARRTAADAAEAELKALMDQVAA